MDFVKICDKHNRHVNLHHALAELLNSVMTPYPFYQWGVDITGPFLIPPDHLNFLNV